MALKLYNSLTRKKEIFEPLTAQTVKIYNCGITPHDVSHLGHGVAALRTAMVRRYLCYIGFDVIFVQNVTDVDDKIIAKSNQLGIAPSEIALKYTAEYNSCLADLRVPAPDYEPKVSQYIDKIIAYIEVLIAKGSAYVAEGGDVYFNVASKPDYGKLSGRDVDELIEGSRELSGEGKHRPQDFALWKVDAAEGASWASPWGQGRPGWHIECSVMSNDLLGATLDIHCGGLDLLFPHHENELAQCEAHNNVAFVNYWVHVGLLNINGTKMSKSLGNFIELRTALTRYGAELLNFVTAKHHYRSPIDFTDRSFQESLNQLCELYELVESFESYGPSALESRAAEALDLSFRKEMDEDLNTPRALQVLFAALHRALDQPKEEAAHIAAKVRQLANLVGLLLPGSSLDSVRAACLRFQADYLKQPPLGLELLNDLLAKRQAAREARNWTEADQIRDQLLASGITVSDSQEGKTIWQFTVLPG